MHYGAIKHLKLTGLTGNTNFDVPAGHILIGALVRNNALTSKGIQIRKGGVTLSSNGSINAPSSGDWNGHLFYIALMISDVDETFEVYESDWSNTDVDVILIMDDTTGL